MEKREKEIENTDELKMKTTPSPAIDDGEPEVNYRGLKVMPFIIGNETFEKLGAIGSVSNLQVYLTTVFNMKRISATSLINIFTGTTNLATLIGAFLSDTYFGRYKTLGFGSVASFFGLLVLSLTAVFANLHPPHCPAPGGAGCVGPDSGQLAFLLFGFGLMVVGAGGIRPCNLAFGADQFDPKSESGKRGVDSFFNWYYFTLTFAEIVSVTLVIYVQSNVSWSIGLGIPAIFMFLSCFLFFIASKMYVKVLPEGSPLTSIVQVAAVAAKKRRLKLPEQPWQSLFNYTPPKSQNSVLPYTDQFRFLNKAAIITTEDKINPEGSAADPWNLCSVQQIEEAKCVLRVIPVALTAVLYHIGAQQQYVIFQALQSDRRLGATNFNIPAASYVIFAMLAIAVWVPLYDRLLGPLARRLNGGRGISSLSRIGAGIFITILESIVGALVEQRRRAAPANAQMSAMWLVPQLAMGGLAEGLNAIGQLEFYYKEFPENMRSIAGAFFFTGNALSNYAYTFLISTVHRMTAKDSTGNWLPEDLNEGRLDYFYYLMAVLCSLNFCYFLVCASWYRYKGTGDDTSISLEMEPKKLDLHTA